MALHVCGKRNTFGWLGRLLILSHFFLLAFVVALLLRTALRRQWNMWALSLPLVALFDWLALETIKFPTERSPVPIHYTWTVALLSQFFFIVLLFLKFQTVPDLISSLAKSTFAVFIPQFVLGVSAMIIGAISLVRKRFAPTSQGWARNLEFRGGAILILLGALWNLTTLLALLKVAGNHTSLWVVMTPLFVLDAVVFSRKGALCASMNSTESSASPQQLQRGVFISGIVTGLLLKVSICLSVEKGVSSMPAFGLAIVLVLIIGAFGFCLATGRNRDTPIFSEEVSDREGDQTAMETGKNTHKVDLVELHTLLESETMKKDASQ